MFWGYSAIAQSTKNNETVALMNEVLSLYAADEISTCTLFELTGILEQKQRNTSMRMTLSEIEEIKVSPSAIGYNVNCRCGTQQACFNLVKSDMSSNPVAEHVFLLRDLAAANTLGFCLSKLVKHYQKDSVKVQFTAAKDASGRAPIIMNQTTESTSTSAQSKQAPKSSEEETEHELHEDDPKPASKTKKQPTPATHEERNTSRKLTTEELDEEADEKATAKSKRKKSEEESDDQNESKEEKQSASSQKASVRDGQASKMDAGCVRWLEIIQSGLRSGFKDIEGKELNADTRINESKIKLRNTKRNYLSMYREQRAFIAEFKSHTDFGLLSELFDAMQEELDTCLGGQWDTHDRSGDEEYSEYKGEIRDVEYRHESDPSLPGVRLIILEDGGKYTFFVRICKS